MDIIEMRIMLNFSSQFKLVEFEDGKFGARRGWLTLEFLDLHDPKQFTWYNGSNRDKYCKGTRAQAESAIELYNKHKANQQDVGKVV